MQSPVTLQSPFEESTQNDVHAVLDGLVRALGSTLDVDELALCALGVLREHLATGRLAFYVLDHRAGRALRRGASFQGGDDLPPRWRVGPRLESHLRATTPLCALAEGELPPEFEGFSHALRLVDGDAVVGFVLIDLGAPREMSPFQQRLLQTMGRMIGATLSRALVHQTLTEVMSRLDSAQRLQQHILDHVSHEFNTPLMILRSTSEFAQSGSEEERTLFFDMHAQALDRLEELVQGVLEVARSRAQLQMHEVGVEHLARAVLEPALDAHPWPPERVHRWMRTASPARITIDPDAFSLAFEHLVRNAWQFGGEQGASVGLALYTHRRRDFEAIDPRTRLRDYLQALRADTGDSPLPDPPAAGADVLVIELADTGIGIPADEFELVFEPFTQARNSPLRSVSGAGMGLPTCRRRIEDMGGEVFLASREGEGTVLSLVLPLDEESA